MIKFCPKCYENHINKMGCCNGYYWCLKSDVEYCWIDGCNHKLVNIDFPASDLKILTEMSNEPSFYQAMIDLHDKDIIEYELKMSQFRNQEKQQKSIKERKTDNAIKCPYCNSTNVQRITAGQKMTNTMLFGIFGTKRNKNFHCNNCKSDF